MVNIKPNDEGLRELALFAGAGGGILGGHLLGWRTVAAVEYNAYARSVLLARQNDGTLPPFPIWDDVRTFDGRPWCGRVDVVSGGFPCQDISAAGKGAGIDGERSGLWSEMARIISEVRPRFAYMENSPMLTSRGLGRVLGDLAEMGFDAKWGVLSCADVGGVHLRERIWIVATNTNSQRRDHRINHREERFIPCNQERNIQKSESKGNEWQRWTISNDDSSASNSTIMQCDGCAINAKNSECKVQQLGNCNRQANTPNNRSERGQGVKQKEVYRFARFPWGEDVRGIEELRNRSDLPEPIIRRIGNDVAFGVDRLKAIGNGQVPRVAATAWEILSGN